MGREDLTLPGRNGGERCGCAFFLVRQYSKVDAQVASVAIVAACFPPMHTRPNSLALCPTSANNSITLIASSCLNMQHLPVLLLHTTNNLAQPPQPSPQPSTLHRMSSRQVPRSNSYSAVQAGRSPNVTVSLRSPIDAFLVRHEPPRVVHSRSNL